MCFSKAREFSSSEAAFKIPFFAAVNSRVFEKRSRMLSGNEVEGFTFVICNTLK